MRFLTSSVLALAVLAIAGPALAQGGNPPARPNPFDQIDTNRNGIITLEEATAARAAMFDRIDTNRDGTLSAEERQASMRGLREVRVGRHGGPYVERPTGGPAGQDRRDRGNVDTNGDGVVTRAEWDVRSAAAGQAATRRAADAFTRIDSNRDGQLSASELAAARQSRSERRVQVRERRAERSGGGARMDTNNDGLISRAEWMAVPDVMHQRADANNDGQVTRAEAEAAWRRGVRAPAGQR
jgi:hypothetical protein